MKLTRVLTVTWEFCKTVKNCMSFTFLTFNTVLQNMSIKIIYIFEGWKCQPFLKYSHIYIAPPVFGNPGWMDHEFHNSCWSFLVQQGFDCLSDSSIVRQYHRHKKYDVRGISKNKQHINILTSKKKINNNT